MAAISCGDWHAVARRRLNVNVLPFHVNVRALGPLGRPWSLGQGGSAFHVHVTPVLKLKDSMKDKDLRSQEALR